MAEKNISSSLEPSINNSNNGIRKKSAEEIEREIIDAKVKEIMPLLNGLSYGVIVKGVLKEIKRLVSGSPLHLE